MLGLFNSRSAAQQSSWLLLSLALLILHVQAQRRYAHHRGYHRGYRGRRIGQPRISVEAPMPHLPFPVPITLLGGGAKLMFPPPPKDFAHANFLPHSEPVDGTSGVIKIQFSKNEDEPSLAAEEESLDQEKKIASLQTTTAATTTTTLNKEQKSHFVVLQDFVLPLETESPLNIPKALTSNIGQLPDVDILSNSIPELTTFDLNEELLTVKQSDIVFLTSESPINLEMNTLKSNDLDLTPKFNSSVNLETHNNTDAHVKTQNISDLNSRFNSTINLKPSSLLSDVVNSVPIDSNALEVLPLFSETHGSVHQELLRLPSTNREIVSDHRPNNLFGETKEDDDGSESLNIADDLPNTTVKPIVSSQSTFEGNILVSTSEIVDVPVTDNLLEEFNEINEQESFTTEPTIYLIDSETIEPQPFKRSNQGNEYQPIWVTHDFGSTNKASPQKSLSSVSHNTWRNPTWH